MNPLKRFFQFVGNPSHSRTLGILAILVMVAAVPLTVYIAQQRQEVRQRAQTAVETRFCQDLEVNSTIPVKGGHDPAIHKWKSDCSKSCTSNSDCPTNEFDSANVAPAESNWCYGFADGSKCLLLVRKVCQTGTEPACEPTLSVTTLSANPTSPAKSTATTITANGQGNPIKIYISSVSPQGANPPLASGGVYSSGMTFDSTKYYFIGSTNPVAQPPTTTIQITSPSTAGTYYLFANAYDKEPPTKTCSWDNVRYDLNPKTNKGACTNEGVVPFAVGGGTTGGEKIWVGGKVTNSKDSTKGIKDVEIQVYNNDAPAGVEKIQKTKTDANGAWHVENHVGWGDTYAVWITGNLANPKTAPPGFNPPAKTTTIEWAWDNCLLSIPENPESGGNERLNSPSYECQRAEQTNRKDCSGPDGSGNINTTLRCNFAYDPAPFPDAKIQFDNTDIQTRSKNISAGQTIAFKATLHANQGTLSLGEIWVAKKEGTDTSFCPGEVKDKWCAIKAEVITDGSTTKAITGSWVSKTTTPPGEYWGVVNAKDTLGGKCSGNPLDPLPADWTKCDPNNLDKLTVVVGAAAPTSTATATPTGGGGGGGGPTATATSVPPATATATVPPQATSTPSPTPTFTPGGTQLAFELVLQGVGPNGGNQNPKKPGRELKVQVFDVNNKEVANKSGQITFDSQSQTFKGTVDLGVIQSESSKFVIKVKTKRYLRKLIDGVTTLTLGALNKMPVTTMIVGDINNDNKLNIEDYNILVGCYSDKANTSSCTDKENADLDDNGVIDGIDYNLFVRSLSVQEGD